MKRVFTSFSKRKQPMKKSRVFFSARKEIQLKSRYPSFIHENKAQKAGRRSVPLLISTA